MSAKRSKTASNLDFLNARLDGVRLSPYERMKAKDYMARTEAVAEFLGTMANVGARLVRALVIRPLRRLTASLG